MPAKKQLMSQLPAGLENNFFPQFRAQIHWRNAVSRKVETTCSEAGQANRALDSWPGFTILSLPVK
jgi:hypothetical protein